jgi:hypothetical protein
MPDKLGTWGQAKEDAPAPLEYLVVDYFGHDIKVIGDPLSMELVMEEFLDLAAQMEGTEDVRALGAVRQFLRALIAPDDFNEFWRLVKTNRQDVVQQMAFGKWLMESLTDHPTDGPSDSSTGRPVTQLRSEDDASSRAKARLEEAGRPDLAEAILLRREFHATG